MLLLKILMSKQGKWQFLFAAVGFLIGMIILLLSLQMYLDLRKLFAEQEKKQEATTYLFLNKQVSLLNTFDNSLSGFSQEEIDEIASKEFFVSVGEFVTNNFSVEADFKMQLGFNTDLFLEAVPDKFIDNKPEEFKWKEGDELVPVIISSEFLNLYNFGFALSQGLPQLPREAIQMFPFELTVKGKGKNKKVSARVVAFSDRIPSVVIPMDFMLWANKNLGDKEERKPSRLIVEVQDPGDERISSFLAEKKYQTNQEKLKISTAGNVVKILSLLTGTIGLLFVILSFIIFVINFQLIVSRAKDELNILFNLGYKRTTINLILNLQLGIILVVIVAAALGSIHFTLQNIHHFFAEQGFQFESGLSSPIVLTAISGLVILLVINSITLRFSLR